MNTLLNAGAEVDSENDNSLTPLGQMIKGRRNGAKDMEIIAALIEAGADVNDLDKEGWSILHFAACEAELPVVLALISAGAEVNVTDMFRSTPLHCAAGNNVPSVIDAILDAGADGMAKDMWGKTPFDSAEKRNSLRGTNVYWRLNDAQYR